MQSFGLARLGRDAELRQTPSGDAVASLSLAFSYGRKGEDNKRPTQWVDASIWGKRAESLAQYLTKGSLVSVTLEDVHIETYQARDGSQGSKLVGKVTALEFAGSPQEGGQQQPRQQAPAPRQSAAPQRGAQQPQRQAPQQRTGTGFDDMDDSIPF